MKTRAATLSRVNDSALNRYAELLAEAVETLGVALNPAITPAPGSPAASELRAACEEPARTGAWGERPVRTAYALASMNYRAALEQARAMAALMTGEFTAVPVIVLARALVEIVSQTWWLLEPEIGHLKRVRRLQALRYRSAVEGQLAASADGIPEEDHHLYTETTAQVEKYSQSLDLEVPYKDGYVCVCGTERLKSPSRRINDMFKEVDVPSVYNIYSGFSHGELFALWQGYEIGTDDRQADYYLPAINELSFQGAVSMVTYALSAAGYRAVKLFGLDQEAVDDWAAERDAILHPK